MTLEGQLEAVGGTAEGAAAAADTKWNAMEAGAYTRPPVSSSLTLFV